MSFCPDLDHGLLFQYVQCLGSAKTCKNIDRETLMTMLPTFHAGLQICETYNLKWFESDFLTELLRSDSKNMSFADHLENYLSPNWTEENSFCMDDGLEVRTSEIYMGEKGLCFFLNLKERLHSERLCISTCLPDIMI